MIFNRLAISSVLFAAVSPAATTAEANNNGKTKVNISIQPAFHGIPVYAAQQFGWFDELGLDVELSVVSGCCVVFVGVAPPTALKRRKEKKKSARFALNFFFFGRQQ